MRSTSTPKTLLALCCALALTACDDKKEEGGDKGKTDDKAKTATKDSGDKDKDKPADTKDGGDKDKGDGGAAAADGGADGGKAAGGKEPSVKDAEIAALKAELEAANEALEAAKEIDAEAAKALDAPVTAEDEVAHEKALKEGETGPVSLAKVSFTDKDTFGKHGTMFQISADVTVNEKKEGGLYAKASCVVGTDVFINVATISNKYGDMGKMAVGDVKRLETYMFTAGLPEKPTRCQLAFDYGANEFSTRLSNACWDGKTVTDGECAEPVKAAKSGEGKIVPFNFKVDPKEAMGKHTEGAIALNVAYAARFNEHIEKAPHLHTKTACKVGEKTWVEVSPDYPHVKPFSLENGEAVMVHHNQFFMNPLPAKPDACNLEVLLDGGYGKEDEKLSEVCAKASGVTEGRCEFRTDPTGEAEAMTPESVTIDEVAVHWSNDWRDKKKAVLNVRLAATVAKRIKDRVQLTAVASCGDTKDKEHHIGPDLEYIGAGETIGIRFTAFRDSPLDKPDGRCEVSFGAKPFMGGDAVEITHFCLKGDKLAAGKCKGRKKGKPLAMDVEATFPVKKAE